MLASLHIENIAVIKNLDIELTEGFTVLTGETGAGKSIIIDSINLILGAKPEKELIRSGESKALVSAMFRDIPANITLLLLELGIEPDEEGALLIQRTITAEGKSSTRINGRPATVSQLRDAGILLINIHGQHNNQTLLSPQSHIRFLDSYAEVSSLLTEYEEVFSEMQHTRKKIADLMRDAQEKTRITELLEYQIADIDSAKLKVNEEEDLLARRDKIKNIERISKQVRTVYKALYHSEKGLSAFEQISRASDALSAISDVMPQANEFIEKLNSFRYELEDIALSTTSVADEDFDNPDAELDKIESRLDVISKLKRKYGSDITEILAFREEAAEKLRTIEQSGELIDELNFGLDQLTKKAAQLAGELSKSRREAAVRLESAITEELKFLEMAKVRFTASIKPTVNENGTLKYTSRGTDDVEFMLATNPGEPLKPLSKIASGGELSRIMLAMKSVFAEKDNIGTLIYDEIDTGVSGKTSQKIGIKLRQTAKGGQVLCVTHSAQIAALADNHLLIKKNETDGRVETTVTPLDYESRVNEIARIMGGMEITDSLRESAKELMEKN